LREVSAVAVSASGDTAWLVSDERGLLYPLDLETGELRESRRFAPDGDFEGIEVVDDAVFVVSSDGVLFRTTVEETIEETVRFESRATNDCDVEGLAHDDDHRRLLVLCKGRHPHWPKRQRAILAFDLEVERMEVEPAFVVDQDQLARFLAATEPPGLNETMARDFDPSAIASSGRGTFLIASTRAEMLVEVDGAGRVVDAYHLRRAIHPQPEGLDVDSAGRLFISSEGRDGTARLLRFDPRATGRRKRRP
jgi:uncharacterized protein YjiK